MQLTYWTMAFYIVFDLLSILFTIPNFNAIGLAFMLCGLQEIKQRECEQLKKRGTTCKVLSPSASKFLSSLLGKVTENSRKAMVQIPSPRKGAFIEQLFNQNIGAQPLAGSRVRSLRAAHNFAYINQILKKAPAFCLKYIFRVFKCLLL
ncbi:hypothetical protein Patl1_34064 [Pistacia atlantica]|uniref:Uncharacterized protein n=1 Tax=Pistacia atlantica TaxID=434234 RepID=A0ACC0ZV94_9ROSI|nr:hypothetical protein Patl1_34064 [Pistacia atlantica]